ncbi:Uncharacterised protein [Mycobacterium tuberculosis]|nr:Uncharacterised protein [Mycobacterium tuberculosis]CKV58739.1 Uncharacterised protein [Mycobacterium tuberculosis]
MPIKPALPPAPPAWPTPPDPPLPPLPYNKPPGPPACPVPGAPLVPLPIRGRPSSVCVGALITFNACCSGEAFAASALPYAPAAVLKAWINRS